MYEEMTIAAILRLRDEASDWEDWRTCDECDNELNRRERELWDELEDAGGCLTYA